MSDDKRCSTAHPREQLGDELAAISRFAEENFRNNPRKIDVPTFASYR